MRKLYDLYKEAPEIKFDYKDNLVFISDVHRGDGTIFDSFMQNKNIYKTALAYYYKRNFIYVEIGDGDELWKNKDFSEIAYTYKDMFKILNKFKEENRIYILYGNHDIIKREENFYISQYRILKKYGHRYGREFLSFIKNLSFYEGIKFIFTPINKEIFVFHGHQLDRMNSKYWKMSSFLVRYPLKFLNGIAGFKDPTSPAKNNKKGNKIDIKLEKWSAENDVMIICGHTHNSRMPKTTEIPYFNDGCCVLPYAMTAIEIEEGNITLVKWIIETDTEGILRVVRKKIYGPKKLEDYLMKIKK